MLRQLARAIGASPEIQERLRKKRKEVEAERERFAREHANVAEFNNRRKDQPLLAAQASVACLNAPASVHIFDTFSRHQQLSLVQDAGQELEKAILLLSAIPADLRDTALKAGADKNFRRKKSFIQILSMFRKI